MRSLVLVVLLVCILSTFAFASVPPMINYQGKLMQPSGVPVPDNTYSMTFAIYSQPTGETALWSETNTSVQVKGGLFSVLLGSVNNLPSNIFDNERRWFGVTIGTDPEMAPRQRIASVPYAQVAGTVPDGSITTVKLADQSVTVEKLMPGAGTPSGAIMMFGGSAAPNGWLICNGSVVSRTTYAALFAAIGTTYGAGDGTTTFNLPDLRTRVAAGLNSTVTEFNALGKTGGEVKHTLSVAEMPSHGHVQNAHTHTQDAHSHVVGDVVTYSAVDTNVWVTYNREFVEHAVNIHGSTGTNNTTATNQNSTATNQNTGGGQAFSVLQPYVVVNYIIKM